MSERSVLGALAQQPLHPRLAEMLRRIHKAEKTATGDQRRPTFRLMREVLTASIHLGVAAKLLAECLGTSAQSVRNRVSDPDAMMGRELISQLTDLTPEELDVLSHGELTRNQPSAVTAYRTIDVVRALVSIPPDKT